MRLILKCVSKSYPGDHSIRETRVLNGIEGDFASGRFVSIVGPSGCGKTTLLRIIAGLEKASEGQVILEDDYKKSTSKVGMVFQEYALFPWRTTVENIEMGLEIHGVSRGKRRSEALKYVRSFGLSGFENHYPHQLSGGMQQRVAIARTLILKPSLVLMDEPFGSLDSQTRNDMQKFLTGVCRDNLFTIVFITHNVDEAVFLSDEIVVFSKRPAKVIDHFVMSSPHPRDRTSPEFNKIRRAVLGLLESQRNGMDNAAK